MEKEATHLPIDLFFEVIFHSSVLVWQPNLQIHLPNLQKNIQDLPKKTTVDGWNPIPNHLGYIKPCCK